jgi:hypothetical protein
MKTVQIMCQFQLPVFNVACQKTAIIGFLKILQCGETADLSAFLQMWIISRYKPTLFYAISAGLHF